MKSKILFFFIFFFIYKNFEKCPFIGQPDEDYILYQDNQKDKNEIYTSSPNLMIWNNQYYWETIGEICKNSQTGTFFKKYSQGRHNFNIGLPLCSTNYSKQSFFLLYAEGFDIYYYVDTEIIHVLSIQKYEQHDIAHIEINSVNIKQHRQLIRSLYLNEAYKLKNIFNNGCYQNYPFTDYVKNDIVVGDTPRIDQVVISYKIQLDLNLTTQQNFFSSKDMLIQDKIQCLSQLFNQFFFYYEQDLQFINVFYIEKNDYTLYPVFQLSNGNKDTFVKTLSTTFYNSVIFIFDFGANSEKPRKQVIDQLDLFFDHLLTLKKKHGVDNLNRIQIWKDFLQVVQYYYQKSSKGFLQLSGEKIFKMMLHLSSCYIVGNGDINQKLNYIQKLQLNEQIEAIELEIEENQFDLELEQSGLLVAHKKTTLKSYCFLANLFLSLILIFL